MTTPTRLVIVDDDASLTSVVAMMAKETLSDEREVHIRTLTSVDAATAAIDEICGEPDVGVVFVSDYHLPPSHRTGLDILAHVRVRIPDAKRVLMSGRERAELEPHLSDARLDGFLAKPFTLVEFGPMIQRMVREARRSREADALGR